MDVILLGVKAHGLTQLAPQIQPLIGENTTVVSTQNGVPWWYFQLGAGEFSNLHLERVDPGGVIARSIDARRVLGSLVYFATDVVEPGVIRHTEGNRISLGEPDGTRSERCRKIAELLIKSGLRCPVTARIKHEIWVKILGNVAFNPISALTRATLVRMARDPDVSVLVRNIMTEVEAVAAKLGAWTCRSRSSSAWPALRRSGSTRLRCFRTWRRGGPSNSTPLPGAVVELADRLGVPVPNTRAVYACTKLLKRTSATAREEPIIVNRWVRLGARP